MGQVRGMRTTPHKVFSRDHSNHDSYGSTALHRVQQTTFGRKLTRKRATREIVSDLHSLTTQIHTRTKDAKLENWECAKHNFTTSRENSIGTKCRPIEMEEKQAYQWSVPSTPPVPKAGLLAQRRQPPSNTEGPHGTTALSNALPGKAPPRQIYTVSAA